MKSKGSIPALLETIKKKHMKVFADLHEGATERALEVLRALSAPPSFIELYAAHDGSSGRFFAGFQLLPIAAIVAEREAMARLLASEPEWQEKGWWDDSWVPFLSDSAGQLYGFDPKGCLEGGRAGQLVFFDHESGPRVELASFDVFVDLALGLAKKGLLLSGPDDPTFDDLYEDARGVGAAKMAAKERKAALARISALRYPAGDEAGALALALPLAKHYAADIELWQAVTRSAEALGQWELVASAAAKVLRLERPTERHTYCGARVFALHMLGRDDEALAVLSQVLRGLDSPISVGMAIPGHNQRDLMAVQSPKTAAFQRRCLALWTELEPTDVEAWKARSTYSLDDAEWRSCLEKVVALLDEQLQREPIFGADAAKASRRDALEQLDRARGTRSIARPKVVLHRLGEWPIGDELLALLRSAGATEDALGAWHYFHVRDDEDLLAHLEESHRHPEMEDRLMAVSDVLATTYGRFPTLARSFALTCGFHWSATEAELTKAFETAGYTVVRTTDWLASTPIPDADRDALPAKLRAIVTVSYS